MIRHHCQEKRARNKSERIRLRHLSNRDVRDQRLNPRLYDTLNFVSFQRMFFLHHKSLVATSRGGNVEAPVLETSALDLSLSVGMGVGVGVWVELRS